MAVRFGVSPAKNASSVQYFSMPAISLESIEHHLMELPSASGNTKVVEKGRRLVDADKVGACSYTLSDENIYLTGLFLV